MTLGEKSNETKMMMWDTGASAFDLITDEAT